MRAAVYALALAILALCVVDRAVAIPSGSGLSGGIYVPDPGTLAPERYELAFTTKGGDVRYGRVHATRVTDSEGRTFGDLVVISDVSELRGAQEDLLLRSNELAERVKELTCLHEISKLAMDVSLSLDEFLIGVVELLPQALQRSDRAGARITLDGKTFATGRFREKLPSLSSEVMCEGEAIGRVEVCCA